MREYMRIFAAMLPAERTRIIFHWMNAARRAADKGHHEGEKICRHMYDATRAAHIEMCHAERDARHPYGYPAR